MITNSTTKICKDCKEEKEITTNFYKQKKWYHSYCKACMNIRSRNRPNKKYNKENRAKASRKYYQNHKEAHTKRVNTWRENNLEKARFLYRKNAHVRRGASGKLTQEQWDSLCREYNHLCVACYEEKPLTIDHIVPVSLGGTNTIDNIQPLCQPCNSSKNTKTKNYLYWFMVA